VEPLPSQPVVGPLPLAPKWTRVDDWKQPVLDAFRSRADIMIRITDSEVPPEWAT